MITKNINNGNLSANYDTVVATAPREWQAKLWKKTGSTWAEVECSINKLEITKGSCGTSTSFSVGNIVSSMLTAELRDLTTAIKGFDIRIDIGLYTTEWEWITVGQFTAVDVTQTVYSTSVTGYGFSTSKMAGAFTVPVTLSLANIINAITSATGVTINADSGINTARELGASLPNAVTCYSALQLIAQCVGGYVVDNPDGTISIKQYSSVTTGSISSERMAKLPELGEYDFTVTGVKVLVSEATEDYDEEGEPIPVPEVSYTYGSPIVLQDANEYMTAELFDIFKAVVGYSYRDGVVDVALGDPRIEGTDVLSISDVNGNTYVVPCHQVVHSYDGGVSTKITAVMATTEATGMATGAPINQVIDDISTSAELARGMALSAQESAEQAKGSARTAYEQAQQAIADASVASSMAQNASQSAQSARIDAGVASASANTALSQLGVVEDIVGVLDFITKDGVYEITQDTAPIADKWYFTRDWTGETEIRTLVTEDDDELIAQTAPNTYALLTASVIPSDAYVYSVVTTFDYGYFLTEDVTIDPNKTYYTRSGTAPDYVYTQVENPTVADISTYYEYTNSPHLHGYYEITGVEDAIKNYLSSRLVVTGQGLWIQDPRMQTRILLSPTNGVELYGIDGFPVASYGETAVIGRPDGFHIEINGEEIGFYQTENLKVAYVRNNQLFIPQSTVLSQMDLGLPYGEVNPSTGEVGLGQWSWKLHKNGESPKRHNLYLKWMG